MSELAHGLVEETCPPWRNLHLVAAGNGFAVRHTLLFAYLSAFCRNATNLLLRALGTPLEWPEAKKEANRVRTWGIEVRLIQQRGRHVK